MRLWNCIYIFVGMILITSQGVSEPSKPISSMMDTPASVFDVYLFRIWQKLECNDVQDIAPCMVRIEYQFDDNIIEMTFRILVSDDQMKEFETATDNQKENILINILGNLAIDVGVAYFKTMSIRYGWIQETPIRNGWGNSAFDAETAIKEIVSRTVILLSAYVPGFLYQAKRDHHGKVSFEKIWMPTPRGSE